jgi:hypothetical protein
MISVFFGVIFTGLLYGLFASFGIFALLENATGIWSMFPIPLVPLLVAFVTGWGVRGMFRRDAVLASGLILSVVGTSCIGISLFGYLMGLPGEPWLVSFLVSLIGFGAIMFELVRKGRIDVKIIMMTSFLIVGACMVISFLGDLLYHNEVLSNLFLPTIFTFSIDYVIVLYRRLLTEGSKREPAWITGIKILMASMTGAIISGILAFSLIFPKYCFTFMRLMLLIGFIGFGIAYSQVEIKKTVSRVLLLAGFPLFLIGVLCEAFEDLADFLGIYGMPSVVVAIVGFIIFFCGLELSRHRKS